MSKVHGEGGEEGPAGAHTFGVLDDDLGGKLQDAQHVHGAVVSIVDEGDGAAM